MALFGLFRKKNERRIAKKEYNYTIKYKTNPPSKVYEVTDEEKAFIEELFAKSEENNLDPQKYTFTRLANGTINVDYDYYHNGGFVGKVKLQGNKQFIMYMENLYESMTVDGGIKECVAQIEFWFVYIKKYLLK